MEVVSKLDNGFGGMDGGTVMSEEGIEKGADDAPLWGWCPG